MLITRISGRKITALFLYDKVSGAFFVKFGDLKREECGCLRSWSVGDKCEFQTLICYLS